MSVVGSISPWLLPSEKLSRGNYSRAKAVVVILSFRLCYLLAMAMSCWMIPEHNPGDGVLRFDMRLSGDNDDACFCRKGQACDGELTFPNYDNEINDCAIPSLAVPFDIPRRRFWKFFLDPSTKWDAARFLNLAVRPSLRDPPIQPYESSHSWQTSEEAHAFFPLFPETIQKFALVLYHILPKAILPPTYESLLVLSGLIFNNLICLTVATLALYELTILVTKEGRQANTTEGREAHHRVAIVVCLVFGIWNPALVFFATNYSESLFATTAILGHLSIAMSKLHGNALLWFVGIGCWMVGSFTRSNGSLHCLWLLQDGLAHILLLFRLQQHCGVSQVEDRYAALPNRLRGVVQAIVIGIQTVAGAVLVGLPVRYHDMKGWDRHCVGVPVRPDWCNYGNENPSIFNASSFSLYRYIQDKYWNVGFFRYYEWKQIPNFLLAAPILIVSANGVYRWIHWSLVTNYGKGKLPSSPRLIFWGWPIDALSESVAVTETKDDTAASSPIERRLVENPVLLGHYAILSILVVIGLVIAHVQISTRMICSTCPAIIWIIAQSLLTPPLSGTSAQENAMEKVGVSRYLEVAFLKEHQSRIVWFYLVLYMLLGVLLHVNFLPWT